MFKKSAFIILALISIKVMAATQSSQPMARTRQLNNPAVGSKQSSYQTFGEPQLKGQSGQRYYSQEQLKNSSNSTARGSVASSNQIFGEPKISGQAGQKYYTQEQLNKPVNNPTQGSVTSSEQTFGAPGQPKQ